MTSHVDEGALHAYLDGALEEYPAPEAERVRRHLDACGECRRRLEAERDMRDRATRILATATPRVEAPAFEELRHFQRARAPVDARASRRIARLGWAASVLLAVGVGWALRGGEGAVGVAAGGPAAEAVEPAAGAAPVQAGGDLRVADSDAGAAVARVTPGGEPESSAQVGTAIPDATEPRMLLPSRTEIDPVTVEVASFDGVVDGDEVIPEVDTSVPPLPAPALDASVAPGPELVAEAAGLGASGGQGFDGSVDQPERSRRPPDVVTSANRVSDPAGLVPFGQDDRTSEEIDDGSYSLVVPNLEVLDVRFRGGLRPEGQVVLQRLATGDTLEVIHLPPDIDPSSLERADAADREMALQTASGWIVMRAPIGEDELVDLMRRLLVED